jgi:hypothetical protein
MEKSENIRQKDPKNVLILLINKKKQKNQKETRTIILFLD